MYHKEIDEMIPYIFRYVGTYHQDNYAFGASKVFLRESMEGALQKERQDIQEVDNSFLNNSTQQHS